MGRGLATKSRGGQELKKACATEGIRLAPNLVADTVSELRPVKHAFDAGIMAQQGIDW